LIQIDCSGTGGREHCMDSNCERILRVVPLHPTSYFLPHPSVSRCLCSCNLQQKN